MSGKFDATIEAAVTKLDRAAVEASVHDDPLQMPFEALSAFLKAQARLHEDGRMSFVRALENARQPVQDEELRRAVVEGIKARSQEISASLFWQTIGLWMAGVVIMVGIGFCGGTLWEHRMAEVQIEAAEAKTAVAEQNFNSTIIALNDQFKSGLNAPDAAMWLDLIRNNKNIDQALRDCQPLPQKNGGTACLFPFWIIPPPPVTQKANAQ